MTSFLSFKTSENRWEFTKCVQYFLCKIVRHFVNIAVATELNTTPVIVIYCICVSVGGAAAAGRGASEDG